MCRSARTSVSLKQFRCHKEITNAKGRHEGCRFQSSGIDVTALVRPRSLLDQLENRGFNQVTYCA